MPSFDVISKVNQQELTNAISNCNREISTRFDFKGLHIVIEANQAASGAPFLWKKASPNL